jgi:outer membrane protein assembly factor BamB
MAGVNMTFAREPSQRCMSCAAILLAAAAVGWSEDRAQWGERFSRNMVSTETGLPAKVDPADALGVKWVAKLGNQTWSTPVISGGKVLIGTNNDVPRASHHNGDRGVILCLDERDGSLCWQLVVPKLVPALYRDWPGTGICSPATVEGDRAYTVTNLGEVVCLDLDGQADGNDGPYVDEGRHMTPQADEPMEVARTDADIIWLFDMLVEAGVHQHDSAHSSILLHGDFLYVNTSNGLDDKHEMVPSPEAPSLIVLDKRTGKLVARESEGIGHKIFHSTWSSPALGEVNGKTRVFFCGGDGVCYAFEPVTVVPPKGTVPKLKLVWRFDCDPTAPKENIHDYIRNRQESPSNIKSMPVFYRNRLYVTVGGDIWWGKEKAWLQCIDATGTGDITKSALLWSYPLTEHCCSTPSISNGLAFVADCGRNVHCVDAETGKPYWTHNCEGEIWASTLVADGKVYIGTRRGQLWVFAASKDKQVLCSVRLDSPMDASPVAANGTLYITTMKSLYAFRSPAPQ